MTRRNRPVSKAGGYLTALFGAVASALSSYLLFSPLARAVNCFDPWESSWIDTLWSVGWSLVAVLGTVLALAFARVSASIHGARAFILWSESVLGGLLLVPILLFSSPASESGALSRAECGLTQMGSAAIASIMLLPAVLAALPALLAFSKLPTRSVNLILAASTIVLWVAVFVGIRPWDYMGGH